MNEIARGVHDGCWIGVGVAVATQRYGLAAVCVVWALAIKVIGGRL